MSSGMCDVPPVPHLPSHPLVGGPDHKDLAPSLDSASFLEVVHGHGAASHPSARSDGDDAPDGMHMVYADVLAGVAKQSVQAYKAAWQEKQEKLMKLRQKRKKPPTLGMLEKERREKNRQARLEDRLTLPACAWGYVKPPDPHPKPRPDETCVQLQGSASDAEKENVDPAAVLEFSSCSDEGGDPDHQDDIHEIHIPRNSGRRMRRKKKRKIEKLVCCDKGCSLKYDPAQVLKLRLQTQFLADGDLRHWVEQRTFLPKEVTGVCADEHNFDRKRCLYRLEQPRVLAQQSICQKRACHIVHSNSLQVCVEFFLFCIDRTTNYLYQPGKKFWKRPGSQCTDKDSDRARVAHKVSRVTEWLREQRDYWLQEPTSDHVILPTQTKYDTYKWYREDVKPTLGADTPAKYSTFRNAFDRVNKEGVKLKHRRWLPFMKCDTCVVLRERILKCHDRREKNALRRQHKQHLEDIRQARQGYYLRRRLAQLYPEKYMSIIIDGADQKNYALPYKCEKSHVVANARKTKVGLMGVLAHGIGMYAYTYLPNVEAGSNATIDVLQRTLMKMSEEKGKQLPPTLFLQLDNTCRQNKSQHVKVFLAHLVEAGVFDRIVVSYLPVGHTHEDIDQCYGRMSIYLRKHDALDLAGLAHCISQSQNVGTRMQPQVEHLENFANVSDYMLPFYVHSRWDGISKYFQFRFQASNDPDPQYNNKCVVLARTLTVGDSPWSGLKEKTHKSVVFDKRGVEAPLTLCASALPSSKRAKLYPPSLEKTHRSHLAKIAETYSFEEDLTARLSSCIDRLCLPLHTRMPCTWEPAALARLYAFGAANRGKRQGVSDEATYDAAIASVAQHKRIVPVVGSWYVFKPVEGTDFQKEPYQLGLVRGLTTKKETDGSVHPSAWVQWWVAPPDDPFTGKHKPTIVLTAQHGVDKLDNVFYEAIEEAVPDLYTAQEKEGKGYVKGTKRMSHGHQTKGMYVPREGIQTLKFWSLRHADPSDEANQLTDSDGDC